MGVVVERIVLHDLELESACGFVYGVQDILRKLSAEDCGYLQYLVFVCVGVGGEGDGLVSFFPHSVAMVRHRRPEGGGEGGINELNDRIEHLVKNTIAMVL